MIVFYRFQRVCEAEVCNHIKNLADCWILVKQDTVEKQNTAGQKRKSPWAIIVPLVAISFPPLYLA